MKTRPLAWVGALLFGLWGAAWAAEPTTAPTETPLARGAAPTSAPADSFRADEAAKLLREKKIPKLEMKAVPLPDALRTCEEAAGLAIRLNWPELIQRGVRRTATISLTVRNVTAYYLLGAVLSDAGASGGLTSLLEDGVVLVAHREAQSQPASRPAGEGPTTKATGGAGNGALGPASRPATAPRPPTSSAPSSRPAVATTSPFDPEPAASQPTSAPADPEAVRKALQLADIYQTNGLNSKAAEIYRKVIAENPDTAAAKEARSRLKDMGLKE